MPTGRFFTSEAISENLHRTPEGFLLCVDVPVARTGIQIYAPDEVPADIEPSPNGTVTIERDPDQVFSPETLASYQGKPLTNEHPSEAGKPVDVNPGNYKRFAAGNITGARQGTGLADDLTFADILVWDDEVIKEILSGKRELSVGYDANYIILGPGHAAQSDIRVNHVALVSNGRCGPRCAIRDELVEAPLIFRRRRVIHAHVYL